MNDFFSSLARFLRSASQASIYFMGRLVRDIWLEIWSKIRRQIVSKAPIVITLIVGLIFFLTSPEMSISLLVIGVIIYGFKNMFFGGKR